MRLPFRVLWFLGYHAVLWWALVTALDSTTGNPSFLLLVLGFVFGVGLILQASSRLPAFYHGLALVVLLPGLLFLGPVTLGGAYRAVAMPSKQVTVVSATSHEITGLYANLPGVQISSYTDVRARLSDGSTVSGLIRPERPLSAGQRISLHVDPLGLVKAQNGSSEPAGLVAITLLVLLLAEVEMVSALIRPEGGSFIAASGRDVAARDAANQQSDESTPDR